MARSHWGVASLLCGIVAAFTSAQADTNSVQGLITGKDGKPLAHAEVFAQRTDAAGKRITTKTDDKGHYIFTSLPAGKYSITVVTERGASEPARATATIAADGQPIRRFISPLPYQIKPDFGTGAPANVMRRMVWQPGETGSMIGGRWINASDAGQPSINPIQNLGTNINGCPALRINSAH
jgi:hypothetical protein